MASSCNTRFLNPRLSVWQLALVLTMTWCFSITEIAAEIQLRGEVGGNVTFRCPVAKQKTIKFFYLQKGQIFVNGYYASKNISDIWENTRLDREKTTVHMSSLNVSHSGDYHCHIVYSDSEIEPETDIHLSVTANYSKPEATVSCKDIFTCLVTCISRGGYPGNKMMWNVTGNLDWKVVNNNEMSDSFTMRVNSSSKARFNCSSGEREISCYVGDVTSKKFSICKPKDDRNNTYVIVAAICAMVFISIMVVVLWRTCKKGGEARDERQECGVNGCMEEVISLNVNEGVEEKLEC